MDTSRLSDLPTFANQTPMRIARVELAVRDLASTLAFYRDVIGLTVIEHDGALTRLGAGGVPFLALRHRPNMVADDPHLAGLFHTAFLMPTRGDLARFVLQTAQRRTPVSGVADHLVSEAIYLDDPEGNGVEVYCDRPPQTWTRQGKEIRITTDPLDTDDLLRAADADTAWRGAPAGTRIGHVHLRVGDVATAERFYRDLLGFDVTWRTRGAAFLSTGGYHHHLATNVWHSAGAGPREENRAGLDLLVLEADAEAHEALAARAKAAGFGSKDEFHDPWGTRIKITRA